MAHEWADVSIMGAGVAKRELAGKGRDEHTSLLGDLDPRVNPVLVDQFIATYNLYGRYGIRAECSVGCIIRDYELLDDDDEDWPGAWAIITKAELVEVSSVFRGAVPGTLIVLRSADSSANSETLVAPQEPLVAPGDGISLNSSTASGIDSQPEMDQELAQLQSMSVALATRALRRF